MFPRSYAIVALIASLVIGLVGGIVVVREAPNLFAASASASEPVEGPTPNASRTIDPLAFPPPPAKVVAALHALGTKQTSRDLFPLPKFLQETNVDASTIHLVLTTGDGSELWIGRTSTQLCLLYSSSNPFPADGIGAGSSCLGLNRFAESGLTLQENNDRWTWNGERFTTTIEQTTE
jgi:hypothetical protein